MRWSEIFTCGMFQDMMEKTSMETVMTTVTTLEALLAYLVGVVGNRCRWLADGSHRGGRSYATGRKLLANTASVVVTTLSSTQLHCRSLVCTYQRVLTPVSVAFSYSGSEGTTVGTGATELEASRPEVAVAKACTGSTIMMKAA
jgi:hypothetical protein